MCLNVTQNINKISFVIVITITLNCQFKLKFL